LGAHFQRPTSRARTPWSNLASGDDETGVPAGRSTAGWRLEILGFHASAYEQPRGQRIGVPHVAGVQLVSTPYGRWDGRDEIEDALRASEVVRDADRARDGLVRIGDRASAPSADLVTEQPEPTGPSCPDRTFNDDTTLSSLAVPDRRGLDHEPAVGDAHLQRGVEKGAPRATVDEGCDPLVDLPAQPNNMRARAEGDPVEIDGSGRERGGHAGSLRVSRLYAVTLPTRANDQMVHSATRCGSSTTTAVSRGRRAA